MVQLYCKNVSVMYSYFVIDMLLFDYVKPPLKKSNLDPNDLKNYCSKLIERVNADSLFTHFT